MFTLWVSLYGLIDGYELTESASLSDKIRFSGKFWWHIYEAVKTLIIPESTVLHLLYLHNCHEHSALAKISQELGLAIILVM